MTLKTGNSPQFFLFLFSVLFLLFFFFSKVPLSAFRSGVLSLSDFFFSLFLESPPFSLLLRGVHPFGFLFFSLFLYFPKVPLLVFCPGVLTLSVPSCPTLGARCWRRNEIPTLQSGLNLYIFNTCFLQLLYFIYLAQQSTGQVAKHHNSETIQCAGIG